MEVNGLTGDAVADHVGKDDQAADEADVEAVHDKWFSYKYFLKSSILRPASLTIPAMVKELIGFARGMVIIRSPLVIVICLPCLATQKPAFLKALTARWWLIPESSGMNYPTST